MIKHGEFQFSTEAYGIPGIRELISGPFRMRKYAGRAAGRPVPWSRPDVQTKGGTSTDLMLRSEVVVAVLDLEPDRAYRDLECFDVEEPIREIIEGKLSNVADKT